MELKSVAGKYPPVLPFWQWVSRPPPWPQSLIKFGSGATIRQNSKSARGVPRSSCLPPLQWNPCQSTDPSVMLCSIVYYKTTGMKQLHFSDVTKEWSHQKKIGSEHSWGVNVLEKYKTDATAQGVFPPHSLSTPPCAKEWWKGELGADTHKLHC